MIGTLQLDGIEQIPEIIADIAADIDKIDLSQLLNNEQVGLANLHAAYFASESGPDGQRWKDNAPSTIKQKGHNMVLRGKFIGRPSNAKATKRRASVRFSSNTFVSAFALANSLTLQSTQSFDHAIREAIQESPGEAVLAFGTDLPYSIYNQMGTSRIPARPHLGINETYLDGMTERFADYHLSQLAK